MNVPNDVRRACVTLFFPVACLQAKERCWSCQYCWSGAKDMLIYVGPDQIIPLSGVIGTAVGLALIFWGKVMNGIRWTLARIRPSDR